MQTVSDFPKQSGRCSLKFEANQKTKTNSSKQLIVAIPYKTGTVNFFRSLGHNERTAEDLGGVSVVPQFGEKIVPIFIKVAYFLF